jgi:hypothetical protein
MQPQRGVGKGMGCAVGQAEPAFERELGTLRVSEEILGDAKQCFDLLPGEALGFQLTALREPFEVGGCQIPLR